jgi:adenosylmethionine-8-amino-7-oxononanoate aminotransferase
MNEVEMQRLDAQFIWHPCSQMKDYELFKPLVVSRARGSYIELSNGKKIIDAISSWWCKTLGHNHPALKLALIQQLERFEHVIFANTTNETIVELSQQLASLMPNLNKVFYASEGSCAVEIALKMSLQTRFNQNNHQRKQFLALKNGYHGETLGALGVSDNGLFRTPFDSVLLKTPFIDVPYVSGINDEMWHNACDHWSKVEKFLEAYSQTTTAIIIEPILQGAGGMKIYSKDFLARLTQWAQHRDIHIIADEILTGIGRTGKMLACEHADIQPDFICLSKGLTSGFLPLSAVLTSDAIYQQFYDDYHSGKAFMHSHTHSGNALAASVAIATLKIVKEQDLCKRANKLQNIMMSHLQEIADLTGRLTNLRGIGGMVAADLIVDHHSQRLGYQVFQEAVKRGALLRPLGNTIYWLPPLVIEEQTLIDLKNITLQAIKSI